MLHAAVVGSQTAAVTLLIGFPCINTLAISCTHITHITHVLLKLCPVRSLSADRTLLRVPGRKSPEQSFSPNCQRASLLRVDDSLLAYYYKQIVLLYLLRSSNQCVLLGILCCLLPTCSACQQSLTVVISLSSALQLLLACREVHTPACKPKLPKLPKTAAAAQTAQNCPNCNLL
jgi:hypothetical protein